jgi:hypothetical protein
MSIINGTFDVDLNSWTSTVSGDADILWDNGRARLRIYGCSNCSMMQNILIDQQTLSFDWEGASEEWSEITMWSLMIDGTVIINEEIWSSTTRPGTDMKGKRTLDVSTYIGKSGTIIFGITASPYCDNTDHTNTYLWIDNVTLCSLPICNFTTG